MTFLPAHNSFQQRKTKYEISDFQNCQHVPVATQGMGVEIPYTQKPRKIQQNLGFWIHTAPHPKKKKYAQSKWK